MAGLIKISNEFSKCILGVFLTMIIVVGCIFYHGIAQAASVEIPSSFNPVGSGARAMGMGGAFIAVADDATAASWNPGGLIQLEKPEISVVGSFIRRKEGNQVDGHPETSANQRASDNNLNYVSLTYPFVLFNRNMIISVNHQHLYDFNRNWRFPITWKLGLGDLNGVFDHRQTGQIMATGLAYSLQITPAFSFGITFNFYKDWFGDNGWEQNTVDKGSGLVGPGISTDYEYRIWDRYSFDGFNMNLGVLWNITNKLTLGAVFKTPFTADLKHESYRYDNINPFYIEPVIERKDENEELEMPMSYGFGLAYRFCDQFTISADFFRTEWQNFILQRMNGDRISPISNLPEADSDVGATEQIRLGAEYLIIKPNYVIPLRIGVFYDPAPTEKGTDEFYGFSLGSGISIGKFIFDVAYQYRFGHDVGSLLLPDSWNLSQNVNEHTIYMSLIIHL